MSFLKSARHALGFHTGDWVFDAPGACEQTRRCTGCDNVSTRISHNFSDWRYQEPRSESACTRRRSCDRCSLAETEQEHSFQWRYYDEIRNRPDLLAAIPKGYKKERGPCAQIRGCDYCPTVGAKGDGTKHVFRDLGKNPRDGEYYFQCTRCNRLEKGMLGTRVDSIDI